MVYNLGRILYWQAMPLLFLQEKPANINTGSFYTRIICSGAEYRSRSRTWLTITTQRATVGSVISMIWVL